MTAPQEPPTYPEPIVDAAVAAGERLVAAATLGFTVVGYVLARRAADAENAAARAATAMERDSPGRAPRAPGWPHAAARAHTEQDEREVVGRDRAPAATAAAGFPGRARPRRPASTPTARPVPAPPPAAARRAR